MINPKMQGLGACRSVIRELFEYGLKRKKKIGEENVFDFSLGNPSVPCPDRVNSAMLDLIKGTNPISLHGYTSAGGDAQVRAAIAEYISRTHGVKADASNLYMTVGAAASLTSVLTGLVTPGEEVIVLAPYFPEYKVFIERCGGVVREVLCSPEDFQPDTEKIKEAINEKTAAIIVNSPNNPTGVVYTEESIKALSAVLEDKEKEYGKPIYLIADEPYRELVYDGATVPFIPKYYSNTIVCYSYSKSLSIPGERIGYTLVLPTVEDSEAVYQAIAGAARALGYVCAPSLLQKILPKCIGLTSDVSIYDRNRRLLLESLESYGFTVVKPTGAFYLFMKSPLADAGEFSELAKRYELLIVPSDSFGCGGYVRISYCVATEVIERSLPEFEALAKECGLTKGVN